MERDRGGDVSHRRHTTQAAGGAGAHASAGQRQAGEGRQGPKRHARRAIIVAVADLIADEQNQRLSASGVIARAGVSPREYHEAFSSLKQCLLAAYEQALRRAKHTVGEAIAPQAPLLASIEAGLSALLGFLEEEPGWGRLLLGELTEQTRERKQRAIEELAELISDPRRGPLTDPDPPPSKQTTAALTRQVLDTIAAEMNAGRPLRTLAGELMRTKIDPRLSWPRTPALGEEAQSAALETERSLNGRALRVLRAVGRRPGSCNRQVAEASGLPLDSNISAVLRSLQRKGLIANLSKTVGRGVPNQWVASPSGQALTGAPPSEHVQQHAA